MARKIGLILGALFAVGTALWLASGGPSPDEAREEVPISRPLLGGVAVSNPDSGLRAKVAQTSLSRRRLSERAVKARARWETVAAGVRALDSSDQAGLDLLYVRAREAIRKDEEAWLEAVSHSMNAVIGASFEESFFTVSAWIRSSHAPARILDEIWRYVPPADAELSDAHHPAMTQAARYERVHAYGVRELRQQLGQGAAQLSAPEAQRLIAELLPRATHERSLNLSIEMFQLLVALHAPERSIQAALQGHSERDRELLQGVLNTH